MENWILKHKKLLKPKYVAAVDTFNKTYMNRIVALREARDPQNRNIRHPMTQKALATMASILPQNYNKIEKGKIHGGNNITLEHAIKLSIIWGCTVDYIALGNFRVEPMERQDGGMVEAMQESLSMCKQLNEELRLKYENLQKDYARISADRDRMAAEIQIRMKK